MNKNINKEIIGLWNSESLPIINGILMEDGRFIKLMDQSLSDLNPFRDYFHSTIYIIDSVITAEYKVFCGDGSHGSDGWILVLDHNSKFLWMISGTINSIINIDLNDNILTATNNGGVKLVIDISNPIDFEIKGQLYLSEDLVRDYQ